MKYAIIENKTVINVIIYDGESELNLPSNWSIINVNDLTVNIGDQYDGLNFSKAPQVTTENDYIPFKIIGTAANE